MVLDVGFRVLGLAFRVVDLGSSVLRLRLQFRVCSPP